MPCISSCCVWSRSKLRGGVDGNRHGCGLWWNVRCRCCDKITILLFLCKPLLWKPRIPGIMTLRLRWWVIIVVCQPCTHRQRKDLKSGRAVRSRRRGGGPPPQWGWSLGRGLWPLPSKFFKFSRWNRLFWCILRWFSQSFHCIAICACYFCVRVIHCTAAVKVLMKLLYTTLWILDRQRKPFFAIHNWICCNATIRHFKLDICF